MSTYRITSRTGVVARIQTAPKKVFRVDGALRGPRGATGLTGPNIEIQNDGIYLQWRVAGTTEWANLVALADLTGADGREVQIQNDGTYIQWRYAGDVSWTNIVALASLKGDQGDPGADGADGTNGTDGADGKTMLSGSGAPDNSLGQDGDFYIDIADWLIFGPKAAGVWPAGTSLVGPAGSGSGDVSGPAGATGNALARYSGTTGKTIKDSNVTVDDSGNISTPGTVDGRDVSVDGTKLDGVAAGADVTATQLPVATHAATGKTTPVDADEIPIADSAASFGLKKLTWANLKATAKAYFDTLYATIASVASKADDSAVVHNTGAETVAGIKTFSSSPIVPTPSTSTQAANKSYVDSGFGSNSFIFNVAVTGTQDSSNTQFTTPDNYITGTLEVYLNGILQKRVSDYTETTPGSALFDFVGYAPSSSDVITVSYQKSLSAVTGNADTVDGYHAISSATANQLLPLDSGAKLPADILNPAAWQSWTPTFANLSGGTLNYAVYQQIHKTVFFQLKYTMTGANVSGRPNFSVPVTMASRTAATNDTLNCNAEYNGSIAYNGGLAWVDANNLTMYCFKVDATYSSYASVSATVPFTWASGHFILIRGYYEAA